MQRASRGCARQFASLFVFELARKVKCAQLTERLLFLRSVGTWTIKAAEVQDGVVGKVFEAQYDVRPNTDGGAGMSATTVLGVILLLVMIFFGVVVVASVCTAGFSAFFKSDPVIRGPGADGERRMMKRSLSVSAMELGQIASGGFRNNPAQGDDENDTATLLANAASELAAGRSGKRD